MAFCERTVEKLSLYSNFWCSFISVWIILHNRSVYIIHLEVFNYSLSDIRLCGAK